MIITEKKVLEIKDNVKCPELGSINYGKWGALRVEQRELINDLCDSWMYKNILLDNYINNWNELKKWLEDNQKDATWSDIFIKIILEKMEELNGNNE